MSHIKIDESFTSADLYSYQYENGSNDRVLSYSQIYNHSESIKRNSNQDAEYNPYYSPLYESDKNYSYTMPKHDNLTSYEPTSVLQNVAPTVENVPKLEHENEVDSQLIESIVKELLESKAAKKTTVEPSTVLYLDKDEQKIELEDKQVLLEPQEDKDPLKVYNYNETTSKQMQMKLQYLKKELDQSCENSSHLPIHESFTSIAKGLLDEKEPLKVIDSTEDMPENEPITIAKQQEEEVQAKPVMRNLVNKISTADHRKTAFIRDRTRSIIEKIGHTTESIKEKIKEPFSHSKENSKEKPKEASINMNESINVPATLENKSLNNESSDQVPPTTFSYKNIVISSVQNSSLDIIRDEPNERLKQGKDLNLEPELPANESSHKIQEEMTNLTLEDSFTILVESVSNVAQISKDSDEKVLNKEDFKTKTSHVTNGQIIEDELLNSEISLAKTEPVEKSSKDSVKEQNDIPNRSEILKSNSELKIENQKLEEQIKILDKEIEKKIRSIRNSSVSTESEKGKKVSESEPSVAVTQQENRNLILPKELKKKEPYQQEDKIKNTKGYIQPGVYGYLVTNKTVAPTVAQSKTDNLNSSLINNDNSSSILSASMMRPQNSFSRKSQLKNNMIGLKTRIQDEKYDMKHRFTDKRQKIAMKSKKKIRHKKKKETNKRNQAPTIQHMVQPFIPKASEDKISEENVSDDKNNMLGVPATLRLSQHSLESEIVDNEIKPPNSTESDDSLKFVHIPTENKLYEEEPPKRESVLPPKMTLKKNEWKHREDSDSDTEDYKIPINTRASKEAVMQDKESSSRNSDLLNNILLIDSKSPKADDPMFFSETDSATYKSSTQNQIEKIEEGLFNFFYFSKSVLHRDYQKIKFRIAKKWSQIATEKDIFFSIA